MSASVVSRARRESKQSLEVNYRSTSRNELGMLGLIFPLQQKLEILPVFPSLALLRRLHRSIFDAFRKNEGRKAVGSQSRTLYRLKVMTAAELFESITNGGTSDFGQVIIVLQEHDIKWCLIGGLAANRYVTPVYTTDAGFVVVTEMLDLVLDQLTEQGFSISRFEFSVNAQKPGSDLVIQFTRDKGYQPFVERAEIQEVFKLKVPVAALPDLIQGKTWAWEDPRRRLSKRTKDQADLIRIGETYPELLHLLPESVRQAIRDQGTIDASSRRGKN